MRHRHVGSSGLMVSEVGFGVAVPMGATVDAESLRACVREALDLGVTLFDTADVYGSGQVEELLGKALVGVRRESVVLCTKAYWPTGPGPNDRGLSRKHIREAADASLRRLGTDYVDVYLAHRYDHETPVEETMLAFADLVRSGRALYIGVSEWSAAQLAEAAVLARELRVPLVCHQPVYSMLWRVAEAEVAPRCAELGVGQIAASALSGGLLTGKYRPGRPAPAGSRVAVGGGGRLMQEWCADPTLLGRVEQVGGLARAHGLTLAQFAVAWLLARPGVSAVLLGASRPGQLADNLRQAEVALTPEVLARVDDLLGDSVVRDPALTLSPPRRP